MHKASSSSQHSEQSWHHALIAGPFKGYMLPSIFQSVAFDCRPEALVFGDTGYIRDFHGNFE